MKVKDLLAILSTVSGELEVNFCDGSIRDIVNLQSIEVVDSLNYKISYTDIAKLSKDKEVKESKICFIFEK